MKRRSQDSSTKEGPAARGSKPTAGVKKAYTGTRRLVELGVALERKKPVLHEERRKVAKKRGTAKKGLLLSVQKHQKGAHIPWTVGDVMLLILEKGPSSEAVGGNRKLVKKRKLVSASQPHLFAWETHAHS